MTKIKVRTAGDAYAPNPLVKAIELLGRQTVIAYRSDKDADGFAVIYVSRVGAAQALQVLKEAGIEALAET